MDGGPQVEQGLRYEPPTLVELGSAVELTLGAGHGKAHVKAHGPSDGFLFHGRPMTITSA